MSFIPQVTCRKCGAKFSKLRGACPNCGARYASASARAAAPAAPAQGEAPAAAPGAGAAPAQPASFARWQLIFGGILIVAVIVAVIILISASLGPKEPGPPEETEVVEPTPPPTTPPPTAPPVPTIAVTSINILTAYNNQAAPESFTQRTSWAPIQLKAEVYPVEALNDHTVKWRSSDEAVCTVDETGLVTAVGTGSCEIIAECGGVAASCKISVPA